uniref:Putative plasmid replication protein n=1 Tax=Butyrivibrio fibrisolvens TaxID=831 RepID=Q52204_BUTFI|nr:replication initiation protein [Butyrivibrio fibrisolvens]AAA99531.1 putative plasmid replication protein [Butyrivibrio fibrisolvens]prf//2120283B replication protein [Butyrivibrio fibrisolvens]
MPPNIRPTYLLRGRNTGIINGGGYEMKNNKYEIAIERDYKVVKANEIIQRAQCDLGLLEQKTFCYAVSKVKPDDIAGTEYTFSINEYCDVCGINRNDGRTIENVKSALKRLRDKSFYLQDENGNYVLIGWLGKARVSPKSGKIKIKFDEDMQKYLTGLYNNYTQYSLLCVLPMKSAYSIRLYELLKSYAGLHRKEFEIESLKAKLCAPYSDFYEVRRKVLDVAVREINLYTDLEVSWQPINKGRKVVKIHFDIKQRNSWGIAKAGARATQALDGIEGQIRFDLEGNLSEERKTR